MRPTDKKAFLLRASFGLFLSFLSYTTAFTQPELPAKKVDRNVIYGMYSGLALLLDVYYPETPNGLGIIHISGSGWTKPLGLDAGLLNHQGHVKLECAALVEAGYTIFSINHRAVPRFPYPAAVEDAQRAVRFIRYHAEQYNIDPNRIGAVGGSSGGHLVSMLGTLDGTGDPADESPINQVSAKVQCVVARAAPTSFLEGGVGLFFLNIRDGALKNTKSIEYKKAKEASPITYVSADDAPFLLLHGDKDDVVPFKLSEMMEEALQQVGVPVRLLNVKGAGHGPSFRGAIDPPDFDQERLNWLNKHLKP